MKKTILAMLFLFTGLTGYAQVEISIPAIIALESSGNPHAYNKTSGAIGLMQITPVCLEDWNTTKGKFSFEEQFGKPGTYFYETRYLNIADLYNPNINLIIGQWYINTRIKQDFLKGKGTIDDILICYHDGYGNWKKWKAGKRKLGPAMKKYIQDYKRLTKEAQCQN